MKFEYFDKESKLYDLLQFPRILYVMNNEEGYAKYWELFPTQELDNQEHLESSRRINKKLQPYKDEINIFYANEFLSSYDLFNLLTDLYSFFGYESIDDYFEYILSIPEEKLKEDLVYALLTSESDLEENKELKDKAKDLINKQSDLMQFIKDLPTESNYKWNIMMVLENPRKMIQQFFTLLKQLEPIYEVFYQEHIDALNKAKNTLKEALDEHPRENFRALTQYMISDEVLEEENRMLISFVFAYSFVNKTADYGSFFVWGTKMEEGFKAVSKMQGDKIDKITKVFKILGDKTRYEVLKLIASGVTSTKEIANQLGVTSATISYHINSFVNNTVITLSPSKSRKYDVNYEMLDDLWKDFMKDLKQE